jgi:hypothetical protein
MTTLLSHVTGKFNGADVSFHIEHDSKFIRFAAEAALFTMIGKHIDLSPDHENPPSMEWTISHARGKAIYFTWVYESDKLSVEIHCYGRKDE